MKQRISKQRIRKIISDFASTLKSYKLTLNARAIDEMIEAQHTAIILPIKKLKRIPTSSSAGKVRLILKSGNTPKGMMSLSPSGALSHFTFGAEASGFVKVLNRFVRQKKVLMKDVLVIKAFHSGEYFLKVKSGKQGVQFFSPAGKEFAVTTEAEIMKKHNQQINQLVAAQRAYAKVRKAAKIEKRNHLIELKYL